MYNYFFSYIKWPQRPEFPQRAREFYRISRFPLVVGAVDGTHMPIRNPTKLHNGFFNRKGFTSINVMVRSHGQKKFPLAVNIKKLSTAFHKQNDVERKYSTYIKYLTVFE